MTQEHPITPPSELVEQLRKEAPHGIRDAGVTRELHLIIAAYRAGADQELEACCVEIDRFWDNEDVVTLNDVLRTLRTARRPKPPSLKEQALEQVESFACSMYTLGMDTDLILRALESLPE